MFAFAGPADVFQTPVVGGVPCAAGQVQTVRMPWITRYKPVDRMAMRLDSINAIVRPLAPSAGMKSRATMVTATNKDANTPHPAIILGMRPDLRNR